MYPALGMRAPGTSGGLVASLVGSGFYPSAVYAPITATGSVSVPIAPLRAVVSKPSCQADANQQSRTSRSRSHHHMITTHHPSAASARPHRPHQAALAPSRSARTPSDLHTIRSAHPSTRTTPPSKALPLFAPITRPSPGGIGALQISAQGVGPLDSWEWYAKGDDSNRFGSFSAAAVDERGDMFVTTEVVDQACSQEEYEAGGDDDSSDPLVDVRCGGTRHRTTNWATALISVPA